MAKTDVGSAGHEAPAEGTPDPLDFLGLEASLSDEERAIRDAVRDYVRARVEPGLAEWFEREEFPVEFAKELGELGFLGMHLEGYGCLGANAVSYGLACLELEAADSGFRSFVSVQGSLCMFAIRTFGSEEQREAWLPRMAAGEAIGCFALTEPDYGSDPRDMRTRARRDGSDWILSGTKMWITSGSIADVAIVWAQTDEGIRGFLVPTDTPGFTSRDVHGKLSLRASVTSELALDECRLPADAELPGAVGLRTALACLDQARYGIVWGVMGAARTCFATALEYSKTREQFGKPIGGFQLTQQKLADMLVQISGGTLLALHLGRLKDAGTLRPEQISLGKLANTRAALDVARQARSILGASGITLEYPVIRHMTNLESVLTYEGTAEIHSLVLGRAVTGLRAFD